VGEPDTKMILDRSAFEVGRGLRPGFVMQVEPELGVGKVQICGVTPDADFLRIVGLDAPRPQRQIHEQGVTFAWLSPNEWMLTGCESDVRAWLAKINDRGRDDVLAIELSHARVSLIVDGPQVRDVLASLCPLDLWSEAFPIGSVARSLLGESPMFISRLPDLADRPRFRVMVDQTMAAYAVRMLAGPKTRPGILT
jgi:sarcosine oxidase subunit gamma